MALRVRWYWFNFIGLPVTFHVLTDRRVYWQRVCGVAIGSWFFGAISSSDETPELAALAAAVRETSRAQPDAVGAVARGFRKG